MGIKLGIDTSNYKTSVAAVNSDGKILFDERAVLEVKKGNRGLRQSEAVFSHIINMPVIIEKLNSKVKVSEINKICVSNKPRPVKDSYMPVFKVGESFGESVAKFLGVPCKKTTHQESHIMAGYWSCSDFKSERFICLHISGGTTEALEVEMKDEKICIKALGGTQDLHAGQFVDRVGVSLGLNFPAGPELEKLALKAENKDIRIPSSIRGNQISFSGPESCAQRMVGKVKAEELAYSVFLSISKSIYKLIKNLSGTTDCDDILFVGGVMSNSIIKDYLINKLKDKRLYFAQPKYSVDNAVGTALLADLKNFR